MTAKKDSSPSAMQQRVNAEIQDNLDEDLELELEDSDLADILLVPDIEAGNMLAKQLVHLADAEMAGIVLGARVPIMLTSRADNTIARLGSCAIALILARRREATSAVGG